MKRTGVILLFVCFVGTAMGQAQTRTPLQTEAALEQALHEKGIDAANTPSTPDWAIRFTRLRAAAQSADAAAATRIVREIEPLDLPDATRTLCHELVEAVRQERSARNETFTQRTNAAIKKASEACRTAKGESELDPTQQELAAFQDELKQEPREPKVERCKTRLRWTAEAVSTWQDALALRANGYEKEAAERGQKATGFVKGENDFDGPRNVVMTFDPDGSATITWENLPGTEGDIPIRDRDASGQWVTIAVAPAGSTSLRINRDGKPAKPRPNPRHPRVPPSGPALPEASDAQAAAGHSPEDSGKKPAD